MQVYRDLRILTARPTPDEERLAPHRLFGAIDGAVNFSAGRWARAARESLAETDERPVVFVGGTGLYFRALTEGLSDIPPCRRRCAPRSGAMRRGAPRLSFTTSFGRAIRRPPRASTERPPAHLARAGGPGCDGPSARLVSRGSRSKPALAPGEWAGLYLAPDRAELGRASTRGSTLCWRTARSRKSPR